ncbi:hypothetical protein METBISCDRAFT_26517 [Metschnikowia bicuspidata]|uniref:Uncharacterized protein n=1 Tax=Metschnikowia bicuspidata TaxID=27322 RepID=A0A4P9ZEY9_9ASCO|nr:hypothetical protein METBISCDRAFT_26517 [Metschnikowia bicuspidata]
MSSGLDVDGDDTMSAETRKILNDSISLFIDVFINYQPLATRIMKIENVREDFLFAKIINDKLKDDFFKPMNGDLGNDDDDDNEIDWVDEDMDEDLKYLKVLKYLKYKTNVLYEKALSALKPPMCVVESVPGAPMIKLEPADGLQPPMHHVPYASLLSPLVFPQMSHGMFPMSGMGSIIGMGGMDEEKRKTSGADDLLQMRNNYSGWHAGP